MLCLGEMVTLFPIQGGHVKLAERFVGKSWSFALGVRTFTSTWRYCDADGPYAVVILAQLDPRVSR